MLAEKIHIIEPNLFQSEVVKMYGPGGWGTTQQEKFHVNFYKIIKVLF